MDTTTNTNTLTPDKQAEADRIEDILKGTASVEIRRMAELPASKENGELFGETESYMPAIQIVRCSLFHSTSQSAALLCSRGITSRHLPRSLKPRSRRRSLKAKTCCLNSRWREVGDQESSLICPHCHEDARFVNYRKTTLTSLFGSVIYERAFYRAREAERGPIRCWRNTIASLVIKTTSRPTSNSMLRIGKRWLPKN